MDDPYRVPGLRSARAESAPLLEFVVDIGLLSDLLLLFSLAGNSPTLPPADGENPGGSEHPSTLLGTQGEKDDSSIEESMGEWGRGGECSDAMEEGWTVMIESSEGTVSC